MRATDGTIRFPLLARNCQHCAIQAIGVSTCLALTISLFLLARRIAGAFTSPLPVPQLLAVVIITAAWALLVREFSSRNPLYMSLALAVLLALALACSYPGARVLDWLLWPAAMFAVVLCPTNGRLAATRSGARNAINAESESNTEQVLQQLTRIRTEDGHDAIRGTLLAEFAPGQRQTTLYVAFCPPFEHLPQVEINVADDSDAELKLTQVLHNGAQIDVRLPQPADENTTVALELFATDATSQ